MANEMTQTRRTAKMLDLITKSGFQVVGKSDWYIEVARDDSKVFGLNVLCKAAEKIGADYTFTGCKVISRRREGRAVFETVDHTTWQVIRFEC